MKTLSLNTDANVPMIRLDRIKIMAFLVSFLLIFVWSSSFLSAMDPDDDPAQKASPQPSPPLTPVQQAVMAYIKSRDKDRGQGGVSAADANPDRHPHTMIAELALFDMTVIYMQEKKVSILERALHLGNYELSHGYFDDVFLQTPFIHTLTISTLPDAIEYLLTWRGLPETCPPFWRLDVRINAERENRHPENLTLSSPLIMNLGIYESDLYKGFPTFGDMPHLETVTFVSYGPNVMWLPLSLDDHLPHLRAISCFARADTYCGVRYIPKPYLWAPKGLSGRVMMEPPLFQYSHLPGQVGWADFVSASGKLEAYDCYFRVGRAHATRQAIRYNADDCFYVQSKKQSSALVASPVAKKFSMFTLDHDTAVRLSQEHGGTTAFEAYHLTVHQQLPEEPQKGKESKAEINPQAPILDQLKEALTPSLYDYLLERLDTTAEAVKKGDQTAQQNVKGYFKGEEKYHFHTAEDRFMHKVLSAYLPAEMWIHIFDFLEHEPLMVWRLAKRYPAFALYCQKALRAAEPYLDRVLLEGIYKNKKKVFFNDGGNTTYSDDDEEDEDRLTFSNVPSERAFSTIIDESQDVFWLKRSEHPSSDSIDEDRHVSWLALYDGLWVESTITVKKAFEPPTETSKKGEFYALTVHWKPDGKAPWGAFTAGPFYMKQQNASKDSLQKPPYIGLDEEYNGRIFLIHTLNILACEELNAYKEALTHPEKKS